MTKQKKIILGVGLTGLGTLGFFYWKLRREEAEETERLASPLTLRRSAAMVMAPPGIVQRPWEK